MLEAEGFRRRDMIDIFDGGPVVHCPRDEIKAVQRCRPRLLVDCVESLEAERSCWLMIATDFERSLLRRFPR